MGGAPRESKLRRRRTCERSGSARLLARSLASLLAWLIYQRRCRLQVFAAREDFFAGGGRFRPEGGGGKPNQTKTAANQP